MGKGKFLIVILLMGTFTGCWDFHEVDKLAFITMIGIDRLSPQQVKVSLQIPIIQNTLPPIAGGEGESRKFYNITMTGGTVNQAFDRLETQTYRSLTIAQTKSLVIGAEAARQDLHSILDFFVRSAQVPMQALVFIADGVSVEELLKLQIAQMVLPGLAVVWSAESISKYDRSYFIPIWQFHQKLIHESKDTYAPLLSIAPGNQYHIFNGVALFDAERLAGKLNGAESEIFGLLTGLMQSGTLTFELNHTQITLRNVQSKPNIKVLLQEGRPFFKLQVKIRGSLSEIIGSQSNPVLEDVSRYQREVKRILEGQMTQVITKIQHFGSDVLDFGEQFRIQHQQLWQETNWKAIYPKIPFQVEVEMKILSDGRFRY